MADDSTNYVNILDIIKSGQAAQNAAPVQVPVDVNAAPKQSTAATGYSADLNLGSLRAYGQYIDAQKALGVITPERHNQLKSQIASATMETADPATQLALYDLLQNQATADGSTARQAGEFAYDAVQNPQALPHVLLQQWPDLLEQILAGGAGRIAGGLLTRGATAGRVAGSAGASGATAGALSYNDKLEELLQQRGVDITNPDERRAAMNNPELMAEIGEAARNYALTIGAGTALGAGVAGSSLAGHGVGLKPLLKEAAVQAPLDAGTELGAQLTTGQGVNVPDVLLEGVMSPAMSAPEIAIGAINRGAVTGKDGKIYERNKTPSSYSEDVAEADIPENLREDAQTEEAQNAAPVEEPVVTPPPVEPTPTEATAPAPKINVPVEQELQSAVRADRVTNGIVPPSGSLTGTRDQRYRRLNRRTKAELLEVAKKRNLNTFDENSRKKDIVDAILDYHNVTEKQKPAKLPDIVAPETQTTAPLVKPVDLSLPKDLQGAKPRYKTHAVEFPSDVEKALYITAQKNKSAADERYRNFLREKHGFSDAEIDILGRQVKQSLKNSEARGDHDNFGALKAEPVAPKTQTTSPPVQTQQPAQQQNRTFYGGIKQSPEAGFTSQPTININYPEKNNLNLVNDQGKVLITDDLGGIAQGTLENNNFNVDQINSAPTTEQPTPRGFTQKVIEAAEDAGANTVSFGRMSEPLKKSIDKMVARGKLGPVDGKKYTIVDGPAFQTPEVDAKKDLRQEGYSQEAIQQMSGPEAKALVGSQKGAPVNVNQYAELIRRNLDSSVRMKRNTAQDIKPTRLNRKGQEVDTNPSNNPLLKFMDMFASTANLATKMPEIAPVFMAHSEVQNQSAALHGAISAVFQKQLIDKFGFTRIENAGKILIRLQENGMKFQTTDDGRIYFRDEEGKLKLADKKTSEAAFALQDFIKGTFEGGYMPVARELLADFGIPLDSSAADIKTEIQRLIDDAEVTQNEVRKEALYELQGLVQSIENYKKAKDQPYFPRQRGKTGSYAVGFYGKDKDGNLVLRHFETVEDGSRTYNEKDFERVKANAEQKRKTVWKGEQWFDHLGRPVSEVKPFRMVMNELLGRVRFDQMGSDFIATLLASKGVDPTMIEKALADKTNADKTKKLGQEIKKGFASFMPAKNYTGYNEDVMEVMSNFMSSHAYSIVKLRQKAALNSIEEAAKVAIERSGGNKRKADTLEAFVNAQNNGRGATSFIKTLNFNMALLGNVKTALIQQFAQPINYFARAPYMGSTKMIANMPKILTTNLAGINLAFRNLDMLDTPEGVAKLAKKAGFSKEKMEFLAQMKKEGLLDHLVASEFYKNTDAEKYAQRKKSIFSGVPGGAATSQFVTDLGGYPMAVFETASRLATMLQVFDAAQDPKTWASMQAYAETNPLMRSYKNNIQGGQLSKQDFAKLETQYLHNGYGRLNDPSVLRDTVLGNVIFPLTSFLLHQAGIMTNRFVKEPKGRVAFLVGYLPVQVALFGLMGLPGADVAEWIYENYKKAFDLKNADAERDFNRALDELGVGKGTQNFFYNGGFNELGGVNISSSARPSLPGNLAPISMLAQNFLGSNSDKAPGILGNVVDGAKGVYTAVVEGEGDVKGSLKKAMPSIIRNPLNAYDIYQDDVKTASGSPLPKYADMGEGADVQRIKDAASQLLGFTPAELSKRRKVKYLENVKEDDPMRKKNISGIRDAMKKIEEAETPEERLTATKNAYKEAIKFRVKEYKRMVEEGRPLSYDPTKVMDTVLNKLIQERYAGAAKSNSPRAVKAGDIARDLGVKGADTLYPEKRGKDLLLEDLGLTKD